MTFSDSIDFIHKIKKEDVKLFSFFAIIFLIIYGSAMLKLGYNHDELEMINGQNPYAMLRAAGRWFFALWKWIVGANPNSIAFGASATMFVSLSLVILTKSLRIPTLPAKAIFGVIYMIQFQFAYVMQYSFQMDVVAMGMLFIAYASYKFQENGALNLFVSIIFLTLSLAIYQSLILNFCIIILTILYNRLNESGIRVFRESLLKFIICCLGSLTLYYVTCKLSVVIVPTSQAVISAAEKYQSEFSFFTQKEHYNVSEILTQAYYTARSYARNLILPNTYQGEWIYSCAILPLTILLFNTFKQKRAFSEKTFISLTLIGIWIMPFFLILAMLNPLAMGAHNRLGEPVALSCLWMLALPHIQWSRLKSILFIVVLCIMVLKASYYVNEIANSGRWNFEAQFAAYKQMEFEAAKKAANANISLSRNNIILFRFHNDTYYEYDTMLNYPALVYANPKRRVCQKLLPEYEEILKKMPFYPNDGSIIIHKGKVLIKFDSSSFNQKK